VWLQDHLLPTGPGPALVRRASHPDLRPPTSWPPPIVAAVLWLRNRQRWIAFITRVIALSIAGLFDLRAAADSAPLGMPRKTG